jgi:hypothetical protein
LWTWDVVEAFLGSDFQHIERYKELQASPRAEWTDLDIRRDDRENQQGAAWNSGFEVHSRVDSSAKKWYAEMKIPFASLVVPSPQVGTEIRAGLFRIAGPADRRRYVAWQPSGQYSFHVPERFGLLRLTN